MKHRKFARMTRKKAWKSMFAKDCDCITRRYSTAFPVYHQRCLKMWTWQSCLLTFSESFCTAGERWVMAQWTCDRRRLKNGSIRLQVM